MKQIKQVEGLVELFEAKIVEKDGEKAFARETDYYHYDCNGEGF